jgi:predicted metalloprotease with PDZ domain
VAASRARHHRGARLRAARTVGLVSKADVPDPARPWIGLSTANATLRTDNGRLVVAQVRRDTPAEAAGVSVEDEILAIGGYRVLLTNG